MAHIYSKRSLIGGSAGVVGSGVGGGGGVKPPNGEDQTTPSKDDDYSPNHVVYRKVCSRNHGVQKDLSDACLPLRLVINFISHSIAHSIRIQLSTGVKPRFSAMCDHVSRKYFIAFRALFLADLQISKLLCVLPYSSSAFTTNT